MLVAQDISLNFYFFIYLFSRSTTHRVVDYSEAEAIVSYTEYLAAVDNDSHEKLVKRPPYVCKRTEAHAAAVQHRFWDRLLGVRQTG